MVARHGALRSRFPAEDGNPAALVAQPGPVDVEFRDLRGGGDLLETLIAERTNRAFDLARGPLLRVSLFRTGDTEHVLCLVLRHIVADGWSLNVLRDELAAHYTAHLKGEDADLPARPPTRPSNTTTRTRHRHAKPSTTGGNTWTAHPPWNFPRPPGHDRPGRPSTGPATASRWTAHSWTGWLPSAKRTGRPST